MFGADARAGDPDFCEPIISIRLSSFRIWGSWKELAWEIKHRYFLSSRAMGGGVLAQTLHVYTHTTALIQARICCESHNVHNCGAPYLGLRA